MKIRFKRKRVLSALYCLPALFFFWFFFMGNAEAADTGITTQTKKSGSYGSTHPLSSAIVNQLKIHENSDDVAAINTALKQLRNGDILILSVHSNPRIFGLGSRVVNWSDFWKTFGINRLASVVIGGCMAFEERTGSDTRYRYVTEGELDALRTTFNAKTIFAPRADINPKVAMLDTEGIVRAFFIEKKLGDVNLQNRWHYIAGRKLDKNNITLAHLRAGGMALQNCLCKCFEPEGGRLSCKYDKKDPGTSPSCRNLSNGPCFCKSSSTPGCIRRNPPTSGVCYTTCIKEYGEL